MARNTEYTRIYQSMRGVDFSVGAQNDGCRYAHLENIYKDYTRGETDRLESSPGFRRILSLGDRINAIHTQTVNDGGGYAIIHSGVALYRIPLDGLGDTVELPSPIFEGLENTESSSFPVGGELYVLDGKRIVRISEDGRATSLALEGGISPYVPTTYVGGERHEQKNLLTNLVYEKYRVYSTSEASFGSYGLKYRVLSETDMTCAVTGAEKTIGNTVQIPTYKTIGSVKYRVVEISDYAFLGRNDIKYLEIAEGVTRIGTEAFMGADELERAVLPDSLIDIGERAFKDCAYLSDLYLGCGLERVQSEAFAGCTRLLKICYGGSEKGFDGIENSLELLGERVLEPSYPRPALTLEIPVFSPISEVKSLCLNGENISFTTKAQDGRITSLIISSEDRERLEGEELLILGKVDPVLKSADVGWGGFASLSPDSGLSAILGCRVAESFDGRIFLSGNPIYPNTVFYSGITADGKADPTYFGDRNYFNDGVGSYTVRSILSVGDSLAVFKEGDDGGGSIYYHTPTSTDSDLLPRIYPTTSVHSGVVTRSRAISFFDDPVFVTDMGLTSLERLTVNLERHTAVRSHAVNPRLLAGRLDLTQLAVWQGYLCLLSGSEMFLADSRAKYRNSGGGTEYEWFYFTEIGSHNGDKRVYRYSSTTGCPYHKINAGYEGEIAEGEIFSEEYKYKTYYYVYDGRNRLSVYPTEEFYGGSFSPARVLASYGELLLFGTEAGDVCVFNNDKRGVAPKTVAEAEGFDAEEYKSTFGDRIHPYYYSYAGHSPLYAIRTPRDNCHVPHLSKSTVRASLTVKLESLGVGDTVISVGTDKKGYREVGRISDQPFSFGDLSFSDMSFSTESCATLPFREKEKGWVEKDVAIYRRAAFAPIAIYSISYRYTVKGRIKK